jgi:hypothetical protein
MARLAALVAALALGACATQLDQNIASFKRTKPQPRILLMPLDVELVELSAAGLPEPKADWTEAARTHLDSTLREFKSTRGLTTVDYAAEQVPEDIRDEHEQLVKVHGAVGRTILISRFLQLYPTKQGRFDWTLGPVARTLKEKYDADYAMFVYVRDSYSSAGRVAVIIVAAALGVAVPGGAQIGFASLVDLDTGDIVWFNRLARGVGDLRIAPAARETVEVLLKDLPQ